MKKRYIVLIVIAAIILALGGCIYTGYHMIFGSPAIKTTNIEDYGKRNDQRIKSNLMVFPQYIAETASDVEYYYYYQDMIMDPNVPDLFTL